MTLSIKTDGIGQVCVCDDTPQGGGNRLPAALVLGTVVYDHANGHAYTVNQQLHALARLSPAEAEMLKWCAREHPRAAPVVFSGEPAAEEEEEEAVA